MVASLRVLYGELCFKQLDLGSNHRGPARLRLGASVPQPDAVVKQTRTGSQVTFDDPLVLRAGDEIEIAIRNK